MSDADRMFDFAVALAKVMVAAREAKREQRKARRRELAKLRPKRPRKPVEKPAPAVYTPAESCYCYRTAPPCSWCCHHDGGSP